ncbi:MAG: SRPBCC family protein [Micropepsaceae bacterium]
MGCLLLLVVYGAHAADFDPKLEDRLRRGEAVASVKRLDAGTGAQVSAAIDIALPVAQVWPIMTECERAPTFVPGLKSCKILQRDTNGGWDIREHDSSPGWPLPDFRTVFRSTYELERRVRVSRIDGDLKRSEGEWLLVPRERGQSTRVIYFAELEYDTWLPAFLLRDHLAAQMPQVLLALRRQCEIATAVQPPK